jgi:hypothetical protein
MGLQGEVALEVRSEGFVTRLARIGRSPRALLVLAGAAIVTIVAIAIVPQWSWIVGLAVFVVGFVAVSQIISDD